MDVLLNGACGRMGQVVRAEIATGGHPGLRLVAGVDPSAGEGAPASAAPADGLPIVASLEAYDGPVDAILDFSNHAATKALCDDALRRKAALIVATTGQTPEELALIEAAAAEIPVFFAPNYSLGVALLTRFAREAAALMPKPEVEIVETHHDQKLDAPSGTALALAHAVRESLPEARIVEGRSGYGKRTPAEIGIHSLRLGNVVGVHEVHIASGDEIITLAHEAQSRAIFAEGALAAVEFLEGKPTGLYGMDDLLAERLG